MFRKTKVLVVDDERHIARFLECILKREGYEASVAHDGNQALAAVESFQPDAMVLDLYLPGMSGLDVLKKVRANPRHARKTILVLTAKSSGEELDEVRQAGASSLCTKPITPSELFELLEKFGAAPKTETAD